MNETRTEEPTGREAAAQTTEREPAELVARIEQLESELEDVHARYRRIRRSQYRGTALALGLIAVAAVAGAWLLPDSREVLLALGGTGLFAAVLIYFLTPERFIAADVGERVYEALAANQAAIVAELGLRDDRIYLPVTGGASGTGPTVRLFVPQRADFDVPPDDALDARFVITPEASQRGMAFRPSAAELITEFEATLPSGLSDSPGRLATQLIDGLVNGFELVDAVSPEIAREAGRARFAVEGSAYGRADRFDNPVASFLAAGFASGLGTPVRTTLAPDGDGPGEDLVVTCEWSTGADRLAGR